MSAVVASPTPTPMREPRHAIRADLEHDATAGRQRPEAGRHATTSRRPAGCPRPMCCAATPTGRTTVVWSGGVTPIATAGEPVERLVIDEFVVEPAPDPVIGPELAAARTRLGLTVDQLAERTRIRPHVIESIEVDDFAPCGGDFYARGHLRTLARVLAVDVAPLLTSYDEKYADAPIDPRRVFEAELATAGGSIREHPRWPQLVGAGRCGDGGDPGLVDRPAGDGQQRSGHPAQPLRRRLRWTQGQRHVRPAPPDPVPGRADRRRWGRPGGRPRRRRRDRLRRAALVRSVDQLEAAPPVRISTTDGSLEVAVDGEDAAHSARPASRARTPTSCAERSPRDRPSRRRYWAPDAVTLSRFGWLAARHGILESDHDHRPDSAAVRRPADPWLCPQRGRLRGDGRSARRRRLPAGRRPSRSRHGRGQHVWLRRGSEEGLGRRAARGR